MHAIFHKLRFIKKSVIAWLGFTLFGFLGMGIAGAGLYYVVSPVLSPAYGDLNSWNGDWVWPATISAGMLWPVSFLIAGVVNARLSQHVALWNRRLIYCLILWSGAVLAWWFILAIQ